MKIREKDLTRLQHIYEAITLIEDFSSDVTYDEFNDDLKTQSAIIRQFGIIGEATYHISTDRKKSHPDIAWDKLRDFRNALVHEYFRVDTGEVWSTIENDFPILKDQIQRLIEDLKRDG
jgi:uncharacterized protein with HEPN domain